MEKGSFSSWRAEEADFSTIAQSTGNWVYEKPMRTANPGPSVEVVLVVFLIIVAFVVGLAIGRDS